MNTRKAEGIRFPSQWKLLRRVIFVEIILKIALTKITGETILI